MTAVFAGTERQLLAGIRLLVSYGADDLLKGRRPFRSLDINNALLIIFLTFDIAFHDLITDF
jgi:hypothetical protein